LKQCKEIDLSFSLASDGNLHPRKDFPEGTKLDVQHHTSKIRIKPVSTPHPVLYAPISFGGIGLIYLFLEQGIAHTTFLIGHIRANNATVQGILILPDSCS
jgi:hypothetical protein